MQADLENGIQAHRAENWQQALKHYDAAIAANPNESFPYQLRGAVYLERQNYLAALDDFNMAIQLAPYNELGYLGKARTFVGLKDYRWAIVQLTHAIDLVPEDADSAEFYQERATIYDLLNESTLAQKDRQHARQLAT
jgi:tetratricopeptide (TPR) repeat protein